MSKALNNLYRQQKREAFKRICPHNKGYESRDLSREVDGVDIDYTVHICRQCDKELTDAEINQMDLRFAVANGADPNNYE